MPPGNAKANSDAPWMRSRLTSPVTVAHKFSNSLRYTDGQKYVNTARGVRSSRRSESRSPAGRFVLAFVPQYQSTAVPETYTTTVSFYLIALAYSRMGIVNTVREILEASSQSPNRGDRSDTPKGAYWCNDCTERIPAAEADAEPPGCPSCGEEMKFERSMDSTSCAC